MKTLLKLELMQAIWAWTGILLFLILGFTKLHVANQIELHKKPAIEVIR